MLHLIHAKNIPNWQNSKHDSIPDEKLNTLINGMSFYVSIVRSYKLLKTPFLAHLVQYNQDTTYE